VTELETEQVELHAQSFHTWNKLFHLKAGKEYAT